MEKSKGKFGNVILFILEIVIGVLLLINPVGFTSSIIKIAGAILLIMGILDIIEYFRTSPTEAMLEQILSGGLIMVALGIFCLANTEWFISTFTILSMLYGVVLLISGFVKVQWTIDSLRLKIGNWWINGLSAILSIIFSVIIIRNPFETTTLLWNFIGVILIVEAILDIIAIVLGKNKNKADDGIMKNDKKEENN